MNNEIIFIVEEDTIDGGYNAKALGHSIFTNAESIEELHLMVKDAVDCHFDDNQKPKMIRLHFVREEVIPV